MSNTVEISNKSIQAIIEGLKKEGLVLVNKSVAEFGLAFQSKRDRLMQAKSVSVYKVAKYQLIEGVTSPDTIKNMIKDGRLGKNESYKDEKGRLFIITMAIKRLNEA